MSEIKDGGPAFPVECDWVEGQPQGRQTATHAGWHEGMTLRDYFAASIQDEPGDHDYSDEVKAQLVGRHCPSFSADGALAVMEFEAEFRAKWRLMRADAMIRARGAA